MNLFLFRKWIIPCLIVSSTLTCQEKESVEPDDSFNEEINVGLYVDEGAEAACIIASEHMFQWMECRIIRLDADIITHNDLSNIDIFYFPGGNMYRYIDCISDIGKDKIRQRIASGAGYIGTCAGATFAADRMIWRGDVKTDGLLDLFHGTSEAPNDRLFNFPDVGMSQIELIKPHPITDHEPDTMWVFNYNSPFFSVNDSTSVDIIARYVDTQQLAMIAFQYGLGRIFLTGLHTEWEEDDDRDGVSYFDHHEDRGSDWPLMKNVVRWCVGEID